MMVVIVVVALAVHRIYIRGVAVSHQILFVDIFDRLEVTLRGLEFETVVLLEGDLEMFLRFALRRERFTLADLLFLEERSWNQLDVFLVRHGCRILLG